MRTDARYNFTRLKGKTRDEGTVNRVLYPGTMFDPVTPQVSFPELDERWLKHWDEKAIFQKSVEQNKDGKPFVFFEGPPTANGMPHAGHVLTRVMKDVFLRYRSMCGYHVPRKAGWDTHGLPVEVEVEKSLGIHGREAIEEYGVEAFSQKCVESVFKYIDPWREMTRRIGFWVDLDDAYVTFHQSYVQSVWWALKKLFDEGLLYKGYKIVWWWPQGGTALSAGEVGQGYRDVDDPSVVVRFPKKGEEGTSFLAWTTTPWTLSSNIALGVHPDQKYATVEVATDDEGTERLVMASALIEALIGDREHTILKEELGKGLEGAEYEPPFRYAEPENGEAYKVIAADFVTVDTGSGMVHMAPAFGEEDFRVCQERGLGFLQLVKPDGTFKDEVTDFAGRFCKEADRDIIRNLNGRNLLFSEKVYRHSYPFCWRAKDDPLIQYARKGWFIRTTQEIDRVIENNQAVNWEPEHIKDGRFGEFLRTNVDWALSRERFWGTPLPIWINDETGEMDSVDSVEAILERNPDAFAHFEANCDAADDMKKHLMVHKPWIDHVTWEKPGEAGVYRRVSEVIDCWFDSGCMPFAQWGYPHQGKDQFEKAFPADFITEAVDQTRGWFYSLMAISTLVFPDHENPHPFKNCYVMGFITDEKGKKQSKSLKNYTDPLELIEKHGADTVRWALYANSVPGQNTKLYSSAASDALRDFLLKVWNVYSFFVTYANIDKFDPTAKRPPLSERSDLDRYILAELDFVTRDVRESLDAYRSHVAAKRLMELSEALSNWYVRRSRSRFWAPSTGESGEGSTDKLAAFSTLFEVLSEMSRLLAPFSPVLAEAMYQNLHNPASGGAGEESVHLTEYPCPDDTRQDDVLRHQVDATRELVSLGQRVRAERKLKVRQPLAEAIIVVTSDEERAAVTRFEDAIREELNVHDVRVTDKPAEYVEFELMPNFRALGKKLGKNMPKLKNALKKANGSALHAEMEAKGSVEIELEGGEKITLTADEVEVRLSARENFAAASAGGRVVILDCRITDNLRREGMAREVINRVQRARKSMDLDYEARIEVRYQAQGELAVALAEHGERIKSETLSLVFEEGTPAGEVSTDSIDGEAFGFSVTKV